MQIKIVSIVSSKISSIWCCYLWSAPPEVVLHQLLHQAELAQALAMLRRGGQGPEQRETLRRRRQGAPIAVARLSFCNIKWLIST